MSVNDRSNKFAWQKRVCIYINAMSESVNLDNSNDTPLVRIQNKKKTLVLGNLHIESLLGKFQQLKVLNLIF